MLSVGVGRGSIKELKSGRLIYNILTVYVRSMYSCAGFQHTDIGTNAKVCSEDDPFEEMTY
jgi:hypothetical protein